MEQKNRESTFFKLWEILAPFFIYYVAYYVAFLLISSLCNAAMEYFGGGLREYVAEYAGTLTELVTRLSMVISVLPLMPMLKRELASYQKTTDDGKLRTAEGSRSVRKKTQAECTESGKNGAGKKASAVVLTVILAVSSSIGLNILVSLTGLVQTSVSYQNVAQQQYSVVFGVGAVLFGLITPVIEEIVFRGLVFNRMRRYFPTVAAIIASGVLFGICHGNLVQGLYGTCMGILLAYTYERMRSFLIPCLFHAVANLIVYTLAYNAELHARIFTAPGCIILIIISAVCIFMVEKLRNCWKA